MSNKPIVLIVEDDVFLQKAYETSFGSEELTLILARNGEEALELMKSNVPDLAIIDLIMPKKNGIEVIREMKKDERLKNVEILIATNMNQDMDKTETQKLGVAESNYIVKTDASIQEIVERVKKVLAK